MMLSLTAVKTAKGILDDVTYSCEDSHGSLDDVTDNCEDSQGSS